MAGGLITQEGRGPLVQTERGHGGGGPHDDGHGDDHGGEHPTSTGLNNVKVLMWTFIASECLLFGSLISAFLAYLGRESEAFAGTHGADLLEIPYTSVSAFVLLLSSLTMVLALAGVQAGNQRQLRIWLVATALLGLIFVGGQYFEFTAFYHEGLTLTGNMFGSSFYVLTGFHGTHVTIGIIWLMNLFFISLRVGLQHGDILEFE